MPPTAARTSTTARTRGSTPAPPAGRFLWPGRAGEDREDGEQHADRSAEQRAPVGRAGDEVQLDGAGRPGRAAGSPAASRPRCAPAARPSSVRRPPGVGVLRHDQQHRLARGPRPPPSRCSTSQRVHSAGARPTAAAAAGAARVRVAESTVSAWRRPVSRCSPSARATAAGAAAHRRAGPAASDRRAAMSCDRGLQHLAVDRTVGPLPHGKDDRRCPAGPPGSGPDLHLADPDAQRTAPPGVGVERSPAAQGEAQVSSSRSVTTGANRAVPSASSGTVRARPPSSTVTAVGPRRRRARRRRPAAGRSSAARARSG